MYMPLPPWATNKDITIYGEKVQCLNFCLEQDLACWINLVISTTHIKSSLQKRGVRPEKNDKSSDKNTMRFHLPDPPQNPASDDDDICQYQRCCSDCRGWNYVAFISDLQEPDQCVIPLHMGKTRGYNKYGNWKVLSLSYIVLQAPKMCDSLTPSPVWM